MRCVSHCLCKKPCSAVFVPEGRGRPYRKNQEAFSVYLFCRHLFLAHGTLSRIVQVSNTHTEDGYSHTYVLLHHCNSHMQNRLPMLTSKVVEADHSRVRLISLHWVMTLCVSLSTPVSLSERLVNLCLSLLLNSHHTSRFSECSHFIQTIQWRQVCLLPYSFQSPKLARNGFAVCLLPNIKCLLLHPSAAKCPTFPSLLHLWRKAGDGHSWFTCVQASTFRHWQVPAVPKLVFRSHSWLRNSSWYRLSYLNKCSTSVATQPLMYLCTVCLILCSTLFIY